MTGASGREARLRAMDKAQADRAVDSSLFAGKPGYAGDDGHPAPFLNGRGRHAGESGASGPDAHLKTERTGIGPPADEGARVPRIFATRARHGADKMEGHSSSFADRSSHSGEKQTTGSAELLKTPTGASSAVQEPLVPAAGYSHTTSIAATSIPSLTISR